jgi:sugar phosphate permease
VEQKHMFEKIIISIIKSFTNIKYSLSNAVSSNGFDEVRAEEILKISLPTK